MAIECKTLSVHGDSEDFDVLEILPIAIAGLLVGAIAINVFASPPS